MSRASAVRNVTRQHLRTSKLLAKVNFSISSKRVETPRDSRDGWTVTRHVEGNSPDSGSFATRDRLSGCFVRSLLGVNQWERGSLWLKSWRARYR